MRGQSGSSTGVDVVAPANRRLCEDRSMGARRLTAESLPRGSAAVAALDVQSIRYFAYGSNMAASVMADHCPGHRYIGRAQLPGHRLAFTRRSVRTRTGVADIVRADGHSVWGALYELDEAGLFAIDRKEGNGSNYQRIQVSVRPDGREPAANVLTYAVIDPLDSEVQPSPEYLNALVTAAHARALPVEYRQALSALALASRDWL
jgi:gamma-glutamylcyclotransferase (GGCT)/AIG2-like uncharacterized protein YtfP